jgi:hypothetical protein
VRKREDKNTWYKKGEGLEKLYVRLFIEESFNKGI